MPNFRTPDYLPTPREIARHCAEIRASWTPSERRRRTVDQAMLSEYDAGWLPPVIDTASCLSRVRHVAVEQIA